MQAQIINLVKEKQRIAEHQKNRFNFIFKLAEQIYTSSRGTNLSFAYFTLSQIVSDLEATYNKLIKTK